VNSRERVANALAKRPVDRVPVFMWFHPSTAVRLAHVLEIPTAFVGEAMGNDIQQTWVNNNFAMEGIVHEIDGQSHLDWWGITWTKQYGFNQISHFPLAGADRDVVLQYAFPRDRKEALLALMDTVVLSRGNSYLGCDISPCAFEMYWRLRGMEDAMLDIAGDPDLAYEMLGRCADFAIELGELACRRFSLDWFWTGDDVAAQMNMMISPHSWRALVKPHMSRVFQVGKSHALPVAYHCCGALHPIIPDLIDMGMDILNPVQSNCPGMDPLALKQEFGAHIAFMGGVDTQGLLPNASAVEVHRETERLLQGMTADGGGYILAASHSIAPETPDANIFAMYAAAGISKQEILDRAAGIRARLAG
jgi:uroporphyrinogen decarboxylase